jgi:hypothetical protein
MNFTAKSAVLLAAMVLSASGLTDRNLLARTPDDTPETVISIFHAKKGQEKALADVLERSWLQYQHEKVVFDQPHVRVSAKDADGNTDFTEIFTWVNHDAPDHASAAIQSIWKEMNAACEARGGHPAIDFKEVDLIVPKN